MNAEDIDTAGWKAHKPSLSEQYAPGQDVPLGGYTTLLAAFTGIFGVVMCARRNPGRSLPSLSFGDILLLGLATHRLTRVVTRDWVTAPVRAPFTRYEKSLSGGEVEESARGEGLRKAIGQLLTCRFCTGPWVALGLVACWLKKPFLTRASASVFAIAAVSDYLHHLEDQVKK